MLASFGLKISTVAALLDRVFSRRVVQKTEKLGFQINGNQLVRLKGVGQF